MKRNTVLMLVISFGLPAVSFAQAVNKYKSVDDYVKTLGTFDTLPMGTISDRVTSHFSDKTEKARAIYDWIAYNISFDCKAARTGNAQNNNPTDVLLHRKAVAEGYATLFQDMCSSADIRCLTVDGFIKETTDAIGDKETDINHTWDVVQLGQSPDTWFYVDPTWGSGYTDAEKRVFTPAFDDSYFFADKAIFNLQHFPDNSAWKLGEAPKTKKDFYALPLFKSEAYPLQLLKYNPEQGHLKIKNGKSTAFSFSLGNASTITTVTLAIGEPKKQQIKEVKYSTGNSTLSFSYSFPDDISAPVTILVNGKALATYFVEAE